MSSKSNIVFVILVIAFGLGSFSCSKNDGPTAGVSYVPFLTGKVTNQQGAVVPGAGIHFVMRFNPNIPPRGISKVTTPSTRIEFNIPKSGYVQIYLYRHGTDELIDTLFFGNLDAGNHSLIANVGAITNGIYYYRIFVDHVLANQYLTVLNQNAASVALTEPVVRTDADGNFKLPVSVFGVGLKFFLFPPSYPEGVMATITDSVDIVIYKAGVSLVQRIAIDTTSDRQAAFVMH